MALGCAYLSIYFSLIYFTYFVHRPSAVCAVSVVTFSYHYYYSINICILIHSPGSSTWHICRLDELFCVCLAGLNRLASGSGWLRFATSACQMVITSSGSSSAQLRSLHRKFRSCSGYLQLIYSSSTTTRDHAFHVSPFPLT